MGTIQTVLGKSLSKLMRASGKTDIPTASNLYLATDLLISYSRRTVAITPSKSRGIAFEEVKRICQDYALTGLRAMHEAGVNRPFRFIYMSGRAAERDPTKTPPFMPEYSLMRVSLENNLAQGLCTDRALETLRARERIEYLRLPQKAKGT